MKSESPAAPCVWKAAHGAVLIDRARVVRASQLT